MERFPIVPVQVQNRFQNQVRRVPLLAVHMLLNIEADHVPTFGEQTRSPPTEAAAQINGYRFGHLTPML
jgi:hypothetical protein